MDRNLIANKLGVENLKNYIIEEISIGKNEAESYNEEVFSANLKDIENIDSDDNTLIRVLLDIIRCKKDVVLLSNNFLTQMILDNKERAKYTFQNISNENDELGDLANYILDYLDFNSLSNLAVRGRLMSIRQESIKHYGVISYIDMSQSLFDILNDKCKLDKYIWDWTNFEDGLQKVLLNHKSEIISLKSDCELKIELFKINKNSENKELSDKIVNLNREIISLKKEIEMRTDFHNKYYYASQVLIQNTFFGDNLPFIFNLFNFLKKNNLLSYGWSYFYTCLTIGNKEMIPLKSSKKLNFIGRIFYHLSDNLTLHYKDESFKFLQSKFLINGLAISCNFRTNHMKTTYDKNDYPELIAIDDFFEKQRKIYLKM